MSGELLEIASCSESLQSLDRCYNSDTTSENPRMSTCRPAKGSARVGRAGAGAWELSGC